MTDFVSAPIPPPFCDFRKMSGAGKSSKDDGADENLMRKEEVVALLDDVFADDKEASTTFMLRAEGFQTSEIQKKLPMN